MNLAKNMYWSNEQVLTWLSISMWFTPKKGLHSVLVGKWVFSWVRTGALAWNLQFFPGPTFWKAGEVGKGKDQVLHYCQLKWFLTMSQTLTIKRKVTDEPGWIIVAGNLQEHKELLSVFSQLTFLLSSRDWSFAFKGKQAQREMTLLGSHVGSRKMKGGGSMTSPQ